MDLVYYKINIFLKEEEMKLGGYGGGIPEKLKVGGVVVIKIHYIHVWNPLIINIIMLNRET